MENYKNDKIVIVGLGITGLSCIQYLYKTYKILPKITDSKIPPQKIQKLTKHLQCHFNKINETWLLEATLIIISPGVSLLHPAIKKAKNAGIRIIGDIELFAQEIQKNKYNKIPIIAITGTNGKTTVTTMLKKITKKAGIQAGIGGNIGYPVLQLLNKKYQLYILELSSFQLETTYTLTPKIAIILNITENHMNRYPQGIKKYQLAKLKIYQHAKICINNSEDPLTIPKHKKKNIKYINFGTHTGHYHLYQYKKKTWIIAKNKTLFNTNHLKISGKHNYLNILAALALSDAIKIPRKYSIYVLKNFVGLTHRCELVHKHNNILWINDSKSTNIQSTKNAIYEYKNNKGILHVLLGGEGKSMNFLSLKPYIQGKQIQLYCFGKNGKELYQLRPKISTLTQTLEESILIIKQKIKKNDIVLLSPACSSLDQFKNFQERGKIFTKLAKT
ncbi:MAG: UDP-N-acetylmuramoyl-L-alanine--D-glutamate ligase [Candidatus Westeberhardia cardiocondylae]|nr:UDP-N-acetylmuramoyl-L-alanine--D-glutamate ligase [Candidatus Westeberhardia cardiocondylae]